MAARALGIPRTSVTALESLVEMEKNLRTLRISLLYPSGLSRFHSVKDNRPSLR
jgi:hypothetical protein